LHTVEYHKKRCAFTFIKRCYSVSVFKGGAGIAALFQSNAFSKKVKIMVKYKLKEQVDPRDVAAPRTYNAVKATQETLTLRDFARRISRESTVSSMDAMAVLEGLLQIIPDEIANGKIIKLGDFGTFRSTLSSEGAATQEEFHVSNIKGLNVRFRPAKEFSKQLANLDFQLIS